MNIVSAIIIGIIANFLLVFVLKRNIDRNEMIRDEKLASLKSELEKIPKIIWAREIKLFSIKGTLGELAKKSADLSFLQNGDLERLQRSHIFRLEDEGGEIIDFTKNKERRSQHRLKTG